MICNIIPVIDRSREITKEIHATIKLGKRNTKPVLKYSIKGGIPKIKVIIKKKSAKILKKMNGLYSAKRTPIVFNTFRPSE